MDVEACRESQRTLDAEFFLNLLGTREGFLVAVVPYNDVGASFCKATCHSQTDPGARARNDCGFALEREQGHDLGLFGSFGVVMGEIATFETVSHLCELAEDRVLPTLHCTVHFGGYSANMST
jgi:hypothetical protein